MIIMLVNQCSGDNGGDRDRHARGEEITTGVFFVQKISTQNVEKCLEISPKRLKLA